ncbi:uncharacterized protein [Nothobranchius furzeri]
MDDRRSSATNVSGDISSAVHALVSVLQQNLQEVQGQTPTRVPNQQGETPQTLQPPIQTQSHQGRNLTPTNVHQDMTRSFPALFQRHKLLGKRRFLGGSNTVKATKAPKSFRCNCYLLHSNAETTPQPSEELEHVLAGLGKRSLTISEDMDHVQVSTQLTEAYPKMKVLTGGWLLKKASGGRGHRRLTVLPPDPEGYTGAQLKTATGAGKTVIYIVPLQEELDLSPLPDDAKEYEKMPKATCKSCSREMPLQVLALHVQECITNITSSEDEQQREVDGPLDVETNIEKLSSSEDEMIAEKECPLCGKMLPEADLPMHASFCGDIGYESHMMTNTVPQDTANDTTEMHKILCEEDVLRWLATQIDRSKEFHLCVTRDELVERGMKLWQRQKNASPLNPLKVTFIGEAGVDTGALRLEFLTEMVAGLEERLFEGEEGKGKMPKYSISDLEKGLFRVAGEIFAASLAQGGPAPNFLQEWCFSFLATDRLTTVTKNDIYEPQLRSLIMKLEESEDLSAYTEEILNCGYTGQINMEKKGEMIRAIVLHATMQRTPMLKELRDGLDLYKFATVLKEKPKHCRGLFVTDNNDKVDSHYIVSHLDPQMSDKGSIKHIKEVKILNYFQDFLIELEDKQEDGGKDQLTVPKVLQWFTGQSHRHLLLSERQRFKITVCFDHDCFECMPKHSLCFPVVSACSHTLTFPTAHLCTYEEFKVNMATAITCGKEFHMI